MVIEKTIIHAIPSIHPKWGGTSRVAVELADKMGMNENINSVIITQSMSGEPTVPSVNPEAQRIIVDLDSPIMFKLGFKFHKKLQDVVRNRKVSFIHNHGLWLPINHWTCHVAQKNNIPMIIQPHGMLEPWARSYRRLKKTCAWYLYQYRDLKTASVFHATSKLEAENLQALQLNIPIAIIPNGIDIPKITKRSNKTKNKKIALFLSRVHPVKGLISLVRAWSKVCPDDWRVIIAGPDEGGHRNEVEHEIKRHGLTNGFEFIGQVGEKDKWSLYNQADLFILPTHSENFGIVIAEALASGVPVITTKGAPWAELEEYKCGWWIDIGVEPLVKALEGAINLSEEKRQTMGQRGLRLVEQKYSWDKIGKEMVSVYDWILGSGSLPKCVVTE